MISRLTATATAAVFAFLLTAGLAVAADAHSQRGAVSTETAPIVALPMVTITGHRNVSH